MSRSEQKIVQYLNEAHASEVALVRVLQSQIAMTPRGTYRSALETHLGETRRHAARVQARLGELSEGGNPLRFLGGVAESVAGQALALAKTPLDLVRGSGGEEKVLKNAKDACATEALEIATYTTIERLARSVGDEQTASLAASIRADEEKMLDLILREIPKLTAGVVGADIENDPSYEPTQTAAADAAREARKTASKSARKTATKAKRTTRRTPGAAQLESQDKGGRQQDLEAAADAGDGAAAFTLWERLRDTDSTAAEAWLRKAEALGDARAAHRLGMLLWERRDVDAAEETLRRAAADPAGAHALGRLLWRERRDPQGAVEWLDRAAQTDDPAAERDLGIILRDHGDLQGAHYWLSRAAERDDEARHVLAELGADR
jgi:ferritin-like metal-binding protein YciE